MHQFVLVFVSAEVVSSYALKLQKQYPNKIIIPVACVGTVFGYWPTAAMCQEKGYEVTGFLKGFSLTGKFKPLLEDVFLDSIEGLIHEEASRDLKKNTAEKDKSELGCSVDHTTLSER